MLQRPTPTLGLVIAALQLLGCSSSHIPECPSCPEFAARWEVVENECSCPGLSLFFDPGASFELRASDPSANEVCWLDGPHHSDLPDCFDAQVERDRITIDAWDVGCARTPCEGVLSDDGRSIVATCNEGLNMCSLVLAVPAD